MLVLAAILFLGFAAADVFTFAFVFACAFDLAFVFAFAFGLAFVLALPLFRSLTVPPFDSVPIRVLLVNTVYRGPKKTHGLLRRPRITTW